jgi:energy-coupling factor transporter ATP-binding protein EcfA2
VVGSTSYCQELGEALASLIEEAFDSRLESIIVKLTEVRDEWQSFLRDDEVLAQSSFEIGRPGVTLLLGKNGTGKSRFVSSLAAFGRCETVATDGPGVWLRFVLPTGDDHLAYEEAVEAIRWTDEHRQSIRCEIDRWGGDESAEHAHEKDVFNLRLQDLIISSFTESAYMEPLNLEFEFGTSSKKGILELFGLSNEEIDSFTKRQTAHSWRVSGREPQSLGMRENLNFRDYFPEYFLFLLNGSYFNFGEDLGPGSWFDASVLRGNDEEMQRLVSDLRWCFTNATHIDVRVRDNEFWFSFVVVAEASDAPSQSIIRRHHIGKDFDNVTFPYDMFGTDRPTSTAFRRLGKFESVGNGWAPFDIVDLTYSSRMSSLEEIKALFCKFVEVRIEPADDADYVLRVSGMKSLQNVLSATNKLLEETGIGVNKLRIVPKHLHKSSESSDKGLLLPDDRRDFVPRVVWCGVDDEKWFSLDSCSDGQLEVVRLLLRLVEFTQRNRGSHARILLVDEFDRHLNPTVSRVLLDQLDRYGRKFSTHVIVSTHSFGSLDVHKYPQIFAEIDELGFHRLTRERSNDPLVVAERLGVPERDVLRLKKLILVGEGRHELPVFTAILQSNPTISQDVETITYNGLYAIAGTWKNHLRHETADVLLVYDKRNEGVESAWASLVEGVRRSGVKKNPWKGSRLAQIHNECRKRMKPTSGARAALGVTWQRGDTELNRICFFLKEVVESGRRSLPFGEFVESLARVHLHGLEVDDVVDLLPIAEFPNTEGFASWQELRADPKIRGLSGEQFKDRFDITSASIDRALERIDSHQLHPELQRLFARITDILEVRSSAGDPRLG